MLPDDPPAAVPDDLSAPSGASPAAPLLDSLPDPSPPEAGPEETARGDEPAGDLTPVTPRYAGGAGAGQRAGEHVVAAKNRWARAVLGFRGLEPGGRYCLEFGLAWDAAETAQAALDFALAGFDFLAADGSSLDAEQVPGLVRTLPDPHGAWIAGPAYQSAGLGRHAPCRIAFRVPAGARGLALGFRSWRNTAPFRVADVVLRRAGPEATSPPARTLGPEPWTLRHALLPGVGLVLRGQVVAGRPDEHAAYAAILYRDAAGAPLPPPYPGTVSVPGHGASVNLPATPQARRFTLSLRPPAGAASVEIGFRTWEEAGEDIPEVALVAAPEVTLEEEFRLESLCGEDALDAAAFPARLAERLGLPEGAESAWLPAEAAPPVLARARALREGEARPPAQTHEGRPLPALAGQPAWPLPEAPDWCEDPFRSVAWRLDYQSLAWMPGLPGAPRLTAAWIAANPWGQPADALSLHPAALTARAETLAGLLPEAPAETASILLGACLQHGFALAEIVGQNAFGRSLHGVQAAAALLVVARALPRLPTSPFWTSLALASLAESVAALIAPDGRLADPGLRRRLDLLGLGRALAETLGEAEPGPLIAARVAAALPGLSGLVDPAGRLPPFGDSPPGGESAGWIDRLLAGRPRALVAGREAEDAGLPPPPLDTLSARADPVGRGFAHFASTFAEQAPQGHLDCTSFVYAADGIRWIVEAGGSEGAETGAARAYLLSARAHNVAVPDGREPVAGSARYRGSLRLDGATAHAIETGVHGPDYRHVRVFLLADALDGLCVLDRFARPGHALGFEGLIHLAPEAIVALSGPRRALAQQGARRIGLVPVALAGRNAGLDIVCGREDRPGALQGFVATRTGLQPGSVLRYALAGEDAVCGGILVTTDVAVEERFAALLAREELARFIAEG
ncbi:heparinase II/III domain-containing protein [Methylobacterium dankookense]|uniref:Heparinase II/III-like C-terminal domain-containing protein n=1 Tax=Methylobacterium dankookense TaxID=560405 RepID=A0A564G4W4_9HYPH|nr:heparinase II/III family protein [Methylobacterium dankookense]GJD56611.1 hypothetical protein IFDJLNFL_2508 [Methylobacterium dankookense]VUF15539.1 hypothetical protein MTDSW087_05282 [Methylobacterium dankookense]